MVGDVFYHVYVRKGNRHRLVEVFRHWQAALKLCRRLRDRRKDVLLREVVVTHETR
jgi:hypothetical protein